MSDDTTIPFNGNNNNGGGKGPKTAKQILAEIAGEAKAASAKVFKDKIKSKMTERNTMAKALNLLDNEIQAMGDEFEAEQKA